MKHRLRLQLVVAFAAAVLWLVPVGRAADVNLPGGGMLAGLPSPPGPHLEKVKSLGDNAWVNLGAPAPDPKWGKACGRSWCSNIPYAADLKGAFLNGEGVHAYVKPDGHFMDDLWFYDVNGHRWICLYPGNDVKTMAQRIKTDELTIDERGLLVDKAKEPLPADFIHAWGMTLYDPELRKFVYFAGQLNCYFANGAGGVFEEAHRLYVERRKGKEKPLMPFTYDVATGKFDCHIADPPLPADVSGLHSNMLYIPSRKQYFFGGSSGIFYIDPIKNAFTRAAFKGPAPEGYDNGACYDSKRDRIYYGSKGVFFIFDVATNTWAKPELKGACPTTYSAAFTSFYYDSVNDKVVAIQYDDNPKPAPTGIFIYDPTKNEWAEKLEVPKELAGTGRIAGSGFFVPELNAFFFHAAGDSRDNGEMWVYRYKRAPK